MRPGSHGAGAQDGWDLVFRNLERLALPCHVVGLGAGARFCYHNRPSFALFSELHQRVVTPRSAAFGRPAAGCFGKEVPEHAIKTAERELRTVLLLCSADFYLPAQSIVLVCILSPLLLLVRSSSLYTLSLRSSLYTVYSIVVRRGWPLARLRRSKLKLI